MVSPTDSTVLRPVALLIRFMQWSSAAIVLGITSYFVHNWPKNQHIKYWEVISAISVAFFLPGFISPFMPHRLSRFVLPIDIIFSYLWLTGFVFAAQDYNWHSCRANSPAGERCRLKKANESFIFLAFIFTFFAMALEVYNLWAARREDPYHEKRPEGHRSPLDAPAQAT